MASSIVEGELEHEERVCTVLVKAFIWTRETDKEPIPVFPNEGY